MEKRLIGFIIDSYEKHLIEFIEFFKIHSLIWMCPKIGEKFLDTALLLN